MQAAEIDELVEKKFGGSLPAFVVDFTIKSIANLPERAYNVLQM